MSVYLLIILILLGCTESDQKSTTFFSRVKNLEYARSSDLNRWKQLFNSKEDEYSKLLVLNSISKIRNPGFIPFLTDIIEISDSDSLVNAAFFSLGQIGAPAAEETFLNLPFQLYSLNVQKTFLKALSQCCTDKTVSLLRSTINNSDLKNDILFVSAICARKKINTSSVKYSVLDSINTVHPSHALAYYLYYASKNDDIRTLVEMLNHSRDLPQKYLLKSLYQKYDKNPDLFLSYLQADSLSTPSLKNMINKILKNGGTWRNKLYALKLSPVVADSLLINEIYKYTLSKNVHLRLTAIETYVKVNIENALSFLLSNISNEKDLYSKGELIKLLSEIAPKMAYRFIMQNLDKGDIYFKGALLDALALLKISLANKTLHQFVQVEEPYLANKAFENLKSLKLVSSHDYKSMLSSANFSSVANAIIWKNEKKQIIPLENLIDLYKKFNHPQQFEVQLAVLDAITTNYYDIDSSSFTIFLENACHNLIKKKLLKLLPQKSKKYISVDSLYFALPSHLHPDSIIYYSINPKVEIKTNKGTIVAELFSDFAPLTTYNFLTLAKKGFYKNLPFHRVIADFVIQGGDPLGDGWGGPDYLLPSEDNILPFKRGSIGIATSGFDTGGSQFFICQSEQPHLTGNYTLFGQVLKGMEIVDIIVPGDKIIDICLIP